MDNNLYIAATATSPEVDFRFDQHALLLRGESYPENAAAFYAPIIEQLRTYLAGCADATITIDVVLTYFNSSSTKMLFSMFDVLDSAAQSGSRVLMNWYRDEEDETIAEFGEELKSDFHAIEFTDRPVSHQG
jgi:ABC-type amino acid transport substrate-binding protein